MTTPNGGDNFDYTDDSVVARLSFDVPAQALTDITQLTQAMSAMATQQEAIARSTGTWLDYLNQVPQIAERANQAYRESITQLERMSYIQNEMGGGGGNVGPTPTAGPQGQYSTAAPQGYVNPFAGQFMGMGTGATSDLAMSQNYMQGMAQNDPRMFANMMAARGQAVNPALLGMVGGAAAGAMGQGGMGGTGGGQGWGNAAPGSSSPQATQTSRDSSAPPDPAQSGQSTKSEPQNIPATPHEDAPPWQKTVASTISGAQQVVNEAKAGGGGRASTMLGLASAGMAAAGKWSANNPDALGGFGGRLGGLAKGAGAVGLGAMAMNLSQNVGEEVQKYQQLGSVQGGDYQTGIGYEAQARMLALNPFITTEQARTAMQMALSQGFKGGEYDTVMDYMLSNFKEMGVQFSTSKDMIMKGIYSGENVGTASAQSADALRMAYELSGKGGAAFPERQQQIQDLQGTLTSAGVSNDAALRAALGVQEGYSENPTLRTQIPGSMQGVMGNQTYLAQVAAQNGITGIMPEAIPAALTAKGIDMDEAYNEAAKKYAYQAQQQWPDNHFNAIASFMNMMNMMGASLDYNTADELYKKVLGMDGAKDPTKQANESISEQGKGRHKTDWNPFTYLKGVVDPLLKLGPKSTLQDYKDAPGDIWDAIRGHEHDDRSASEAQNFASSGRTASTPPTTPEQAFKGPVKTEGQVTGELRITVDQSGKVNAPKSIQLSGQQKSANAGYGSAQLNNAPPGDPTFQHAYNGWGNP